MLSKLLKNDLRKNMRWLWILYVSTIIFAVITRGIQELSQNIAFFKVLSIFFNSIFYALVVNTIIQPFVRNFINFTKSFYGDESYLTHTLPVTKNQLINSKFITATVEIVLGFICAFVSILIMYYSPIQIDTLKTIISTIIVGDFSLFIVILLFAVLLILEFLMYISIIFYSIVMGYKSNEKRILKTFIIAIAMSFISVSILGAFMLGVLLLNGVQLSNTELTLTNSSFLWLMTTGILVYIFCYLLFYLLTKKEFNKGVNVD